MTDTVVVPAAKSITLPRERTIRTPIVGFRGQLTAAAVSLYQAPTLLSTLPTGTAQAAALLKSIIVCNTDTVTRTITFYAVESGGSAAANRAFLNAVTILTNQTVEYIYQDDCFPLGSGEAIWGLSDLTLKVTVRVNVLQLTPT